MASPLPDAARLAKFDAFVTFALNPDGKIREARMEPVSTLTDFSFDFQDLRLVPVADAVK